MSTESEQSNELHQNRFDPLLLIDFSSSLCCFHHHRYMRCHIASPLLSSKSADLWQNFQVPFAPNYRRRSRTRVTFMCLGGMEKKSEMRKQMKGVFCTVWSQNSSFHSWLRSFGERESPPPPPPPLRNVQDDARWAKRCHIFTGGDALFVSTPSFPACTPHFLLYFIWCRDCLEGQKKRAYRKKKKKTRWLWMLHQLLAHFPASNVPTRRGSKNQHSAWFSLFTPLNSIFVHSLLIRTPNPPPSLLILLICSPHHTATSPNS